MEEQNGLRFLEPSEVQRLMEVPSLRSETGLCNRCIMGLMYEAGLRIGEVLTLKPRDVVIEEKRVEVLRGKGSKPRTVRKPRSLEATRKGRSSRDRNRRPTLPGRRD